MNEDFVSYEIAKKLKEKGFEWCKVTTYNPKTKVRNNHIEPTISQVLKWLREEKKLHIVIDYNNPSLWSYVLYRFGEGYMNKIGEDFNSYEQAVLAGIEYILDNLI